MHRKFWGCNVYKGLMARVIFRVTLVLCYNKTSEWENFCILGNKCPFTGNLWYSSMHVMLIITDKIGHMLSNISLAENKGYRLIVKCLWENIAIGSKSFPIQKFCHNKYGSLLYQSHSLHISIGWANNSNQFSDVDGLTSAATLSRYLLLLRLILALLSRFTLVWLSVSLNSAKALQRLSREENY